MPSGARAPVMNQMPTPVTRAYRSGNDHGCAQQATGDARPKGSLAAPGQRLEQDEHGHEAYGHPVTDEHMQHGVQGYGHAVAQAGNMQDGKDHGLFSFRQGMTRSMTSG